MRRLLICASLILLLFQLAQAQSSEYRGRQYESMGFNYETLSVGYRIFEGDLAGTPSWNPEREDPPISLNQAIGIARANLRRVAKDSDGLIVARIELEQFYEHKWIYRVLFNSGKRLEDQKMFWMLVKMDGTVFEPEFVSEEMPKN